MPGSDEAILSPASDGTWTLCLAVNDPNGPLLWRGRYHLFYQHVEKAVQWGWGVCWGHVSSSDLVTWQHHPPALCPTPGGADADGCFSGCAVVIQPPPGSGSISTTPPHHHEPNMDPPSQQTPNKQLSEQQHGTGGSLPSAEGRCPLQQHGAASCSSAAGGVKGSGAGPSSECVPVLLYTGVVRRPDAPPGLRPSSLSVSELCYEQQLAAVAADPGEVVRV